MVILYLLLLIISMAIFYFTSGVIANVIIRFAISAAIFIILSTVATVMVSKGHAPPPGSKTVDFEEMEKIRRGLNKEER